MAFLWLQSALCSSNMCSLYAALPMIHSSSRLIPSHRHGAPKTEACPCSL